MAAVYEYELTYYPWITQHVDPGDIRQAINNFATVVQRVGDCKITVLKPISVPDQIDWIGKADGRIALMNPLGFVLAKANARIEAINVALRQQIVVNSDGTAHRVPNKYVPTYRAQLYTNVKTAIKKGPPDKLLKQVRRAGGTSLAFGTSYSTSNFLFPAWQLTKSNVNPFTSFSSVNYLGGHDLVAKALYDGRVDVGAGHDGVIEDLAAQPGYGDAEQRLITLFWTDEIPSDPVVVNVADDARRKVLQVAMVEASKTQEGSAALKTFWGGVPELGNQTSAAYATLETCLKDLQLSGLDLLGPN